MPPDINKYRKYVDDFDLTEEQKKELLKTVWSIMEDFVDKAFGRHPVQQCRRPPLEKDLQRPKQALKSFQLLHCFGKISVPKSGLNADLTGVRKETRHYDGPQ